MNMTHYMELLATNQPWNLIQFMVIPVVLAEYIAVSELYILFTQSRKGLIRQLNKLTGIVLGLYFLGIFLNLMNAAVIPLTVSNGWRGLADIIAVGFYLLGVVPLFGITLLELGLIRRNSSDREKVKIHAIFVGLFLIVAHIAMIFGMLNPEILGWNSNALVNTHQNMVE